MKKFFIFLVVFIGILNTIPSYSQAEKSPDLIRLEKKFSTLCPELFKASEELNETSHRQQLNLMFKVNAFETDDPEEMAELNTPDNLPEINMDMAYLQDLKNNSRKIYMSLLFKEDGEYNREQLEIIYADDTMYMRDSEFWEETSLDQVLEGGENLDLGLIGYSFFLNHAGDFDKKRVGDKIYYSLNMTDLSAADLLMSFEGQFGELISAENILDDLEVTFKTFDWTFVIDKDNHLVESNLKSDLSIYNDWSEENMLASIDLHTEYDQTSAIEVTPPLIETVGEKPTMTPANDYKLTIDGKPSQVPLHIMMQKRRGLLIEAEGLKKMMPVTSSYVDDVVTLTMDDAFIKFQDKHGQVITGSRNDDYLTFPVTIVENEKFYVPLEAAIEFLGGICIIKKDIKEIVIYTPGYLEEVYHNKTLDALNNLSAAIDKLAVLNRKEEVRIQTRKENYQNESATYDRINFKQENFVMDESLDVDPVNRYMTYERLVKNLMENDTPYRMQYVLYKDKMYLREPDSDWSSDWTLEEDYLFEWFSYDQVKKYQHLKHLLNKNATSQSKTYTYKLDPTHISVEEEIALSRLIYDPFLLDHIFEWPIDGFEIKALDLTYKIGNDGLMLSQDENYLIRFYDGKRSFDCHLSYHVNYSEYNKTIDIYIPEIIE